MTVLPLHIWRTSAFGQKPAPKGTTKYCAGAGRGGDNTPRLIVGEAEFALLTTGSHMSAFGPLADILRCNRRVRLVPESGHGAPTEGRNRCCTTVHRASENSISFCAGTDTTLGDPHAVEVRNTPNGV